MATDLCSPKSDSGWPTHLYNDQYPPHKKTLQPRYLLLLRPKHVRRICHPKILGLGSCVGDEVYLVTNHMVTDEGSKKLSDLRTGVFPITEKVGEGAYRLELPPHMKAYPVFNVTLLTKAEEDLIHTPSPSSYMEPSSYKP